MLKRILAVLLGVLALIAAPALAHAGQRFDPPGELSSPAGLSWDASRAVYWAANTSGTSIYALDRTGALLGTVTYGVQGQQPTAVEGISFAARAVYVGDIGGSRDKVIIHRIRTLTYGSTQAASYTLRYTDGPHDAKAMAVSPRGNVYIVTSGPGAAIYRTNDPANSQNRTLTKVAPAPDNITDAVFTVDGGRLILRAPEQVIVLDSASWKTVASAYTLPQLQGDVLALAPSNSLLLVSRDVTTPALTTEVPKTINTVRPTPTPQDIPSPSASPIASPTPSEPSPSASTEGQGTDVSPTQVHFEGTMTALAIAAGVALLAGIVVAIKR